MPEAAVPGRSDELVAVAARLFRDRGYDATSVQEIANEMGILKGSLYHYVKTKEDLLWKIVEPPLTELVDKATEIFADTSVPLAGRMRLAIQAHAESYELHHPHMFVIMREGGETISPQRRRDFDALRIRYYLLWKGAIADGVESGELRSDLDPVITVQAVFGMVGWMFRWFTPGGRMSAHDVGGKFGDMLIAGIAAEK